MGLFNTVVFECPGCGRHNGVEVQSKQGPSGLNDFSSEAVPYDIAQDIMHKRVWCQECCQSYVIAQKTMSNLVSLCLVEYGFADPESY